MLTNEHGISTAHKSKNAKKKTCLAFKLSDGVLIMLINVKMPAIVMQINVKMPTIVYKHDSFHAKLS